MRRDQPGDGLGARTRHAARRALDLVPEQRRPALRALALSARALVLGRPLPRSTMRGLRPGSEHAAWIRVPTTTGADPLPLQQLDDPTEQAAVRAGWQLVCAYEALTTAGAARVFAPELEAWHGYARDTLPERSRRHGIQYSDGNWLRFRRMADFVLDGDRVFDAGTGKGELAGILMEVRSIGYRGIELGESTIAKFRAWQREAYPDRPLHVEIGDLYDLTPEQVAREGTTLVMCCEVLEHLPDAEAALEVLARTLPEGADLMFSVPLHGRLEAVWGHVSVFDAHRLHEMVERAGLFVHHVEPLANVWTLVVANRSPARSERVARANRRPDVLTAGPLTRHRRYLPVSRDRVHPTAGGRGGGGAIVEEDADSDATRVRFTGRARLEVPVDGLEAMRLRVAPVDAASARALRGAALDVRAADRSLGRWSWTPARGSLRRGQFRRVAFRPGENGGGVASTVFGDTSGADRVVVTLRADRGVPVEVLLGFGLLR